MAHFATFGGVSSPSPVPPKPPSNPWRVIPFGDSLTANGSGDRTPSGGGSTYLRGVSVSALTHTNQNFVEIGNAGIGGNKSSDLLARMDDVLLTDADIVLLLIGTNDLSASVTPEQIRDNVIDITNQITSAGKSVVITSVPHRDKPDFQYNSDIDKLNGFYQAIAAASKDIAFASSSIEFDRLIDAGQALVVTADKLHPNTYGAQLIGKETAKALDVNFTVTTPTVNLIKTDFKVGGGYLKSGATGDVWEGWNIHRVHGAVNVDGSMTVTSDGVATDAQLQCGYADVEAGKDYVFETEFKFPAGFTLNSSRFDIYIENDDSLTGRVYLKAGSDDIRFSSDGYVKLRTVTLNSFDRTRVRATFRIVGTSGEPFSFDVKNPTIRQV